MSKIPDCAQSEEVLVLCSFWDRTGSRGLQKGTDGRPHEDHGDTELGGIKECEIVACYPRTYRILHKVYQRLCPDHRTYGEIVEEGCHVLLEQRL